MNYKNTRHQHLASATTKAPYEVRYMDGEQRKVEAFVDLTAARQKRTDLFVRGFEVVLADVVKNRLLD